MYEKKTKNSGNSRIIANFFILFVLITLFYVGSKVIEKQKETLYWQNVDKINSRASTHFESINKIFRDIQDNPLLISELYTPLYEEEDYFKRIEAELKRLKPPKKARAYQVQLAQYYNQTGILTADLADLSLFIKERNHDMESLTEEVEKFQSSIAAALTDTEIIDETRTLRLSVDSIQAKTIQSESKLNIFSNKAIINSLGELSDSLFLLEEAVASNNIQDIQNAIDANKNVLSQNWASYLSEGNSAAITSYNKKIVKYYSLQTKVAKTRQELLGK